ncbi:hypothetical protein HU200_006897 [Digitaria exilis]|uniref:Uncharacterized protein n=1 Tax=Digitaria exilis TaxID=1010633 RepID=A0A835FPC0_9POAL|nr:hypothetical protein HU200_006897 [Digitaria exilis]
MRRFVADRARRAVAASLRGPAASSSSRSAAPSPLAPARGHPAAPVGAAAMAAAMARAMSTAAVGTPPVTLDTLNPKVLKCEYAVRGEIVTHAQIHFLLMRMTDERLVHGFLLAHVLLQVLSLCDHPALLDKSETHALYRCYRESVANSRKDTRKSDGAYSHSQGIKGLRDEIAAGIAARDGFHASGDNIFLTDGASPAVCAYDDAIVDKVREGWHSLPYSTVPAVLCIDCSSWWFPCMFFDNSSMLFVLAEENQKKIVEFCKNEGLVLLADEAGDESLNPTWKRGMVSFHHWHGVQRFVLLLPLWRLIALEEAFNSLEEGDWSCQAAGTAPDAYYAKRLLEATGIVVVPGSGFGQHIPKILPYLIENLTVQISVLLSDGSLIELLLLRQCYSLQNMVNWECQLEAFRNRGFRDLMLA